MRGCLSLLFQQMWFCLGVSMRQLLYVPAPPHLLRSQPGPLSEGCGSLDLLLELLSAWHLPGPSGSFSFTVHLGHCTFRVSSSLDQFTERYQEVLNYFGILSIWISQVKYVHLKLLRSVSCTAMSMLAFMAPTPSWIKFVFIQPPLSIWVFGCLPLQVSET